MKKFKVGLQLYTVRDKMIEDMDATLKAVKEMGIPLESAVKCATMNPTKAIGIYDTYGSLTPGKQADVVLLDEDLEIRYIIKSGEVVYGND